MINMKRVQKLQKQLWRNVRRERKNRESQLSIKICRPSRQIANTRWWVYGSFAFENMYYC